MQEQLSVQPPSPAWCYRMEHETRESERLSEGQTLRYSAPGRGRRRGCRQEGGIRTFSVDEEYRPSWSTAKWTALEQMRIVKHGFLLALATCNAFFRLTVNDSKKSLAPTQVHRGAWWNLTPKPPLLAQDSIVWLPSGTREHFDWKFNPLPSPREQNKLKKLKESIPDHKLVWAGNYCLKSTKSPTLWN